MSINKLFINTKKNESKKQINKLNEEINQMKARIEELEVKAVFFESIAVHNFQTFNNGFKKLSESVAGNQEIETFEELVDLILEVKNCSVVCQQHYESLCQDINSLFKSTIDSDFDINETLDVKTVLTLIEDSIKTQDFYCNALKNENRNLTNKLNELNPIYTDISLTQSGDNIYSNDCSLALQQLDIKDVDKEVEFVTTDNDIQCDDSERDSEIKRVVHQCIVDLIDDIVGDNVENNEIESKELNSGYITCLSSNYFRLKAHSPQISHYRSIIDLKSPKELTKYDL